MSSQFTDPFRYYLPPNEEAVKAALATGLVVFDTNVLLSAYRFALPARQELLSALDHVADRIWIPNRVAEEFHRNRLAVISDYDAAYKPVMEFLQGVQRQLESDLEPKINQLANRTAMSGKERDNLRRLVATSTSAAMAAVEKLRHGHSLSSQGENDEILSRYQKLFDGKTGSPLEGAELESAIAEAKRRCELSIPPGYRDAEKPEPYGDYLVWKQTLIEIAKRECAYLLFVTADKKEDWYQIIKGKTISARPELSREAMLNSNTHLVMLDTASFLFRARRYLNAEVSPETIRQSEALPRDAIIHDLHARLQVEEALMEQLEDRLNNERDLRERSARIIERLLFKPDGGAEAELTNERRERLAALTERLAYADTVIRELEMGRARSREVAVTLQRELSRLARQRQELD